jgi:hypothetical protein
MLTTQAARAATLTVTPAFNAVRIRTTAQFKATLTGATGAVTWRVNGVAGGNATVGAISAAGLYTTPATVPSGTTVSITATTASLSSEAATVAIGTGLSFYVSTTGKDTNAGTISAPWRTFHQAVSKIQAGDRVFARTGVYHESVSLTKSGTAAAGSIVLASYPGETAVLDGSTGVACCGGGSLGLVNLSGTVSYAIVEGLEIRNFASKSVNDEPAGILVTGSGSHIQILDNVVHGITETAGAQGNAHGIGIYGTEATPFSSLTIQGNTLYGMVTGNSETLTLDGNIDGFTVTGNLIHDNNNIGIDAAGFYLVGPTGHDQARNGLIAQNTVYNITSLKNPAYNSYGADGIYCDGCTQVVVERNLVYNCDLNIEAASENYSHDSSYVTIRNNLVYGGYLVGISIGGYDATRGGSDHITVVNNTLYGDDTTGWSADFQVQYHATNNLFENNIVYTGAKGILFNGPSDNKAFSGTMDYNLWYTTAAPVWNYMGKSYTTFAAYQKAVGQEAHSRFVNPAPKSVKAPLNFAPATGSPALNAGNAALGAAAFGTLDFAGNARTASGKISIGAYQK